MEPVTSASSHPQKLATIFRALSHRNYRLFFIGQSISLLGTWMQTIALSWLVYRLTNSAFLLGLVSFCGQIPSLFLLPLGGVLVDRTNKLRLLIAMQLLMVIQAALLAALTLSNTIAVWHVFVLQFLLGILNSFEMPCRQSLQVELVDRREDLSNAIALNSSLFNSARLLGPAVAGLLISLLGEGMCFLINALSFIPVAVLLGFVRLPLHQNNHHPAQILDDFREGLNYAIKMRPIRYLVLLVAAVSLIGLPYAVLMPLMASQVLHGGPRTLGFLTAGTGVGALTAALFLAARRNAVGLESLAARAAAIFGLGLVGFAFSPSIGLSFAILTLVGFGLVTQMGCTNTVLQTIVDEDKRGRVLSLYIMSFMVPSPFGSFIYGSMAAKFGAQITLFIGGLLCLMAAGLYTTRLRIIKEAVHPIYQKLGLCEGAKMPLNGNGLT